LVVTDSHTRAAPQAKGISPVCRVEFKFEFIFQTISHTAKKDFVATKTALPSGKKM